MSDNAVLKPKSVSSTPTTSNRAGVPTQTVPGLEVADVYDQDGHICLAKQGFAGQFVWVLRGSDHCYGVVITIIILDANLVLAVQVLHGDPPVQKTGLFAAQVQ